MLEQKVQCNTAQYPRDWKRDAEVFYSLYFYTIFDCIFISWDYSKH